MAKLKNIFADKVYQAMEKADGWMNELTGLGTSRDKSTFNIFTAGDVLDDDALDALYHQEDAAALVCDKVPEDALREGFAVKLREDEGDPQELAKTETDIIDFLSDLDTTRKLTDAWVWANVFGIGVVVLGVDDGKGWSQPLDWDNIKSFDYMNIIEKPYLKPEKWYKDATKADYGRPETYIIKSTSGNLGGADTNKETEIHESRLAIFDGERTSFKKRRDNKGFDYSTLQRTHAVLKQFGVSWDCLAHVIQDAFQGTFKMQGLMEALAQNEHGLINRRLELLDRSRSIVRAVILDAEGEDFARQNFSFIGLDSIYDLFMMRLSMASRIPVTILMGRSPAGENATGDADFQAWYDHVSAERSWKCDKNLEKIIRIALLADNGPTGGKEPEFWKLEYPPLWQPTAKEKSEIFLNYSSGFKNLTESGVVLPEEIAFSSFTPNGFSPEISIDKEARKVMLEQEEEMRDQMMQGMQQGGNGGQDTDPNAAPAEE